MANTSVSLGEIARGLANDEFVFHYQPKVSMLTGQVCGAEALIRWHRPDGELVPPAAFIPLAEQEGHITAITRHMYPKLLADVRGLVEAQEGIKVSFNVSAKDFESDWLARTISESVDAGAVSPESLEVELTESAFLSSGAAIRENIGALLDSGVSLAMDDFGEGFASVDTLCRFPFSAIKLDYQIVSRAASSPRTRSITQSSIRMAHKLGIDVVGEGVSDCKTYYMLVNAGCTLGQGFWISEALPRESFIRFLHDNMCWPVLPVGLLHMAELDHIEWRKTLLDAVFMRGCACNNGEGANWPEMDPTACALGRWYHGPGRMLAGSVAYHELDRPHRRLHEIGQQLREAVEAQASSARVMNLIRQLASQSSAIVWYLQSLQHEAWAALDVQELDQLRGLRD